MSDNFTTLFRSGGGAGTAASDYIRDAFQDISVPATNNTGYSSTVLKNPLADYFANDDAPKYGAKTLWIKDLVLIDDRSKWLSDKPTYRIIWNESYPGVDGYVAGNIRLRNTLNGISVDVRNTDDFCGVTGVFRRVQWILNPTDQTTGTADLITDGVDTGSDATFGSYTGTYVGVNHQYSVNHNSSNETKDIHDYRLQANEYFTLNIAGVTVYYENAGANIDCFPGSTYVDKDKKTTTSASAVAIPTVTSPLGAKISISKTSANTYTADKLEAPYLQSVGVGSGGAASVTVTTGHGSSFPIGSGVMIQTNGSSFFIGSVINVSTDTLTVDRNLPFGVSGTITKIHRAGATLPIGASMYALSYAFDPALANTQVDAYGFGDAAIGNFYYTDPYKRFKAWGSTLQLGGIDGTQGLSFGASSMINLSGNYSALELQFVGASNAILHATLTINGVLAYGVNEGFTGIARRTVFTDGSPGWKEVRLQAGSSMGNLVLSKVNFYDLNRAAGLTFGLLSEFNIGTTYVPIGMSNNIASPGIAKRMFADELYLTGAVGRTLSPIFAGGAAYQGASTNAILNFAYYGKNYGLIGIANGASILAAVDGGAAAGVTLNVMNTVASEGFHTVQVQLKSVSALIEAVDFSGTKGEMVNLQNYLPSPQLDDSPQTYIQSDTPRSPKNGDMWLQKPLTFSGQASKLWVYLLGKWMQLTTTIQADDPNMGVYVRTHGSSTGAAGGVVQDGEAFNVSSWSSISSDTSGARGLCTGSDASYLNKHHVVGGRNSGGTQTNTFSIYNLASWVTGSVVPAANELGSGCAYANVLYANKGQNSAPAYVTTSYRWNGGAWATGNAFSVAADGTGTFAFSNGLMSTVAGYDGGYNATHETKNTSDVVASSTAYPVASRGKSAALSSKSIAITVNFGTGSAIATAYSWNATAWSAAITSLMTIFEEQGSASANFGSAGTCFLNGGNTAANASPTAASQSFNGTSFSSATSSFTSRGWGSVGSVI